MWRCPVHGNVKDIMSLRTGVVHCMKCVKNLVALTDLPKLSGVEHE